MRLFRHGWKTFLSARNRSMNDDEWEALLKGLRQGDPVACSLFWQKYGPLLELVARKQLSARVQRRVGPDDVVQSACRTFFRRVSEGQFELSDSEALWRLMCSITLTKARRAARNQNRHKRSQNREQGLEAPDSSGEVRKIEIECNEPSPIEAVEVADQLEHLLAGLGADECQVLDLKMQDLTNDEIAEKMGCSERTVRRLAKSIQEKWIRLAADEEDLD
jgi:RNA polymerase sigma factor (sigma-70 family)